MVEIESFWNGVKPFKGTQKGKNGRIGYGCQYKRRHNHEKCQKRKAYRQIRKYGFDLSELWSLDCTIMSWLSDNVGGFFRICGEQDSWTDYDLEGNYVDFWKIPHDKNYWVNMHDWEKTRCESYITHLKDFLDNGDPDKIADFRKFVIPRLRKLAEIVHGWPAGDDFPEFEDWTRELLNMAYAFEAHTYSESFLKYFYSLWD